MNRPSQLALAALLALTTVTSPSAAPQRAAASIETSAHTYTSDGLSNNYVEVAPNPGLNFSESMTIEAWVRRPITGGVYQTIEGKDFTTGFWLGLANGRLRFKGPDALKQFERLKIAGLI